MKRIICINHYYDKKNWFVSIVTLVHTHTHTCSECEYILTLFYVHSCTFKVVGLNIIKVYGLDMISTCFQ